MLAASNAALRQPNPRLLPMLFQGKAKNINALQHAKFNGQPGKGPASSRGNQRMGYRSLWPITCRIVAKDGSTVFGLIVARHSRGNRRKLSTPKRQLGFSPQGQLRSATGLRALMIEGYDQCSEAEIGFLNGCPSAHCSHPPGYRLCWGFDTADFMAAPTTSWCEIGN